MLEVWSSLSYNLVHKTRQDSSVKGILSDSKCVLLEVLVIILRVDVSVVVKEETEYLESALVQRVGIYYSFCDTIYSTKFGHSHNLYSNTKA